MSPGADAALFYVSVAALAAGAIRAVRASVERNTRDRIAIALVAVGCAGLAVAVAAFLSGPKSVLPF